MEKVELVKQPMNRNINKNHQFDEGTYMYKNNCYELFAGSICNRMPYAMLDCSPLYMQVIQARGRHEISAESRMKKRHTTVIKPHCLAGSANKSNMVAESARLRREKHKVRGKKSLLTATQCHHSWASISGGPTSSTSSGCLWNTPT